MWRTVNLMPVAVIKRMECRKLLSNWSPISYQANHGWAKEPPVTLMEKNTQGTLKQRVHDFWNEQACDAQVAQGTKFSREYFEEIEAFRYEDQPFIHSFGQFTRYRGKRVLEVGLCAGT